MNDNHTPSAEPAEAEGASPTPDPFAVVEKLNAENTELKDRLLRTLADVENMRRRSEREAADARAYAITAFARDLLSVADNLQRALENVPAEARAAEGAVKTLAEGVELTARELGATLAATASRSSTRRAKIRPELPPGDFRDPGREPPAGTVTQVCRSGWKIGERVLRPAMVGVSKGGPKAAPKVEKAE